MRDEGINKGFNVTQQQGGKLVAAMFHIHPEDFKASDELPFGPTRERQ
jgi:hypothetical protein